MQLVGLGTYMYIYDTYSLKNSLVILIYLLHKLLFQALLKCPILKYKSDDLKRRRIISLVVNLRVFHSILFKN